MPIEIYLLEIWRHGNAFIAYQNLVLFSFLYCTATSLERKTWLSYEKQQRMRTFPSFKVAPDRGGKKAYSYRQKNNLYAEHLPPKRRHELVIHMAPNPRICCNPFKRNIRNVLPDNGIKKTSSSSNNSKQKVVPGTSVLRVTILGHDDVEIHGKWQTHVFLKILTSKEIRDQICDLNIASLK